ncbi:NAD-dependent epimerase/dehydratase family protein [uncultured Roseobacter sp.]|uniref:NAD-dependent epimerase/dehydratase family protein n=1 Tax=uncultured Roseobacter sp. TaxID=114847 RepID=UPI00262381CB|nr:NAD-dependent epimerase/dehydratase family protein [uncultured Roseobacter sp.]
MQVFVLGGTGTIGTAVVAELVGRNHQVLALSRSEKSDELLISAGATPFRGDLSEPSHWADAAISSDGIIQAAATFGEDMGDVDAKAMKNLIQASETRSEPTRLIYTGGCWLYGETGDEVAMEDRPFNPLPSFSWMIKHAQMLLDEPKLRTAVVHPAMVYDMRDGGVFHRFLSAAKAGQRIEIWGSEAIRWPLIESSDLARAYCDLVERTDLIGYFNAAAEEGVSVGRIASVISEAYGSPTEPITRTADEAVNENGAWAKGPTLDQQMSAQKLQSAAGWQPKTTDFAKLTSQWITDLQT